MDALRRDAADPNSSRDFGKDIIPYIVEHGKAVAHRFAKSCVRSSMENEAYWRDVGTIDAYWEANIDLTDVTPELDIYDREWPIWTYAELKPPAKFVHDEDGRRGMAVSSVISGDCIVSSLAEAQPCVYRRAHQLLLEAERSGDAARLPCRSKSAAVSLRGRCRGEYSRRAGGRRERRT
jgi:glucose-1-phosphate adenylyltransferase